MFDTRDLLGAMLGSGMGGRNPRMAGFGSRSGGMLGGGGMMGGSGLGGMLGGGGLGGLGGGGLGGGMMGGMRPGGGGMSGMQGVLLGALGTFAVNALRQRMQQAAQPAPGPVSVPQPAPTRQPASPTVADVTEAGSTTPEQTVEIDEGRARLLIRVMVAAANADMRIDEQERTRILGKIEESGANQAAREFVEREMRQPMSIDDIARQVTGPDVAAQVYAAALAAIDVDKAMERRFLQTLAERTGLDAEIVGEIHDQLGQPRLA
jgi:uncharacterized membrane protein YebE (DUF533 family)